MNAPWTIRIERLPIELAVGVHAHEHAAQAVLVSVVIKGRPAARPGDLRDCIDYEPLLHWLRHEWPATPHVALLETRLDELFERVFALDVRVDSVWAGLYKQALGGATGTVGVERGVARRDFAQQRRTHQPLLPLRHAHHEHASH